MNLRNQLLGVCAPGGQPCVQIKDDEIEVVGKRGSWRRQVLRRVLWENSNAFKRNPVSVCHEFRLKP